MPRTEFHPLTVARVDQLTGDSAAVTFDVPPGLAERFAFAPGQSLTVRRGDERRSYSICAARGRAPRIGVREVAGGAVSGWLVHEVRAGDVIEVQAPSGSFIPDLDVPGHHVLIAAGSGITPELSIASSVLAAQDKAMVTLIYGNRRNDSVMFADEIADLKDAHPERVCLVHVLSREPQEVELFNGRLDVAKLRTLLPVTVSHGTPVLDGAQRVRPDLPFACKGGVCGTCRARLVDGEVTMRRNYALEQEELDAGYVLTCQSLPVSDQITVDYDA